MEGKSKVIDPALFRETLGHYPTGVAVVTAVAEDWQARRHGRRNVLLGLP